MMIETKGTKAPKVGDGALKYVSQAGEARSGTPYYVALAVAALTAYFQSLFQNPVHSVARAEEEPTQPKGGPKLSVVPTTAEEAVAAEPEARLASLSGRTPQSEGPASQYDSAQYLQTRALKFADPDPGTDLNDFKASPVIPMPTNDNGGAARGGGGGGGRDKDDGGKGGGDSPPDGEQTEGNVSPTAGDNAEPKDGEPPTGSGRGPGGTPGDEDDVDGPAGRRNRAPVASGPVYLSDVTGCALLPIVLSDLLRNVDDPDGDSLSVRNVTVSSGSLVRSRDGWVYDADGLGPVTITYQVTDGALSVTQTAVFTVVERNRTVGSDGDDIILGTPCADEIDGRDGNDNIDARAGADVIDGGAGNDHIVGGSGDDAIFGGPGDDIVLAGTGADHVSGGIGNDRLFGEEGDDVLSGDAGDDLLDGGEGDDIVMGGIGADMLLGDAGDDRIDGGDGGDQAFGGSGRDVVYGGAGDDRLDGGDGGDALSDGSGADAVAGGTGDDVIFVAADGEADRFDGGEGVDTLDLSGSVSGVAVDLATGTAVGAETGRDEVASIENVRGGSGNDWVSGNAVTNVLSAGAGRDHVSGGAGNDLIDGGADNDTLRDGTGSDLVMGGAGDDLVVASLDGEADRFDGGTGHDTLDVSDATEDLLVDLVSQVVSGSENGDDMVVSIERILSGSGNDRFVIGGDSVVITGGEGDDRYEFDSLSGHGNEDSTRAVEITDFSVGDYVSLLKYNLFEEGAGALGRSLAEAMECNDSTASGIQYRSARLDGGDVTIITADLDSNDTFETTIVLDGHHTLLFVEVERAAAPTATPAA